MKSKRLLSALLALAIMLTSAFVPTINVVAESSSSTAAEETVNTPEASTNTPATQADETDIADAVAKVGEVYYATLQAAIDAASENGTVTLLCDITPTEQLLINKSLTLDLGVYTITGNSAEAILRTYSPVVDTVINVTINATTGGIVNEGAGYAIYAGEDIDGGTDAERTNLTIKGGNYSTNGSDCIRQIMGLCTVNDGTYKSSFSRTVLNGERWYGSEFAINGGSFYGFNPACVSVWTGFDGKDYTNYYHQHDIIAEGKTAEFNDGWYTVVEGTYEPKVKTKALCYDSAAAAVNAVVKMNDVGNLGTITLLADDNSLILKYAQLAIEKGFTFVPGTYNLTLPEGYGIDNKGKIADLHDAANGFGINVAISRWEEEGKYKFWLFAGIDTLDYKEVGFVVTTSDGVTATVKVTTVYTSITDSKNQTYTATAFGYGNFEAAYIFAQGINFGIDYAKETSITYRAYAITLDGETIYGKEYSQNTIYKEA